MMQNFKIDLSKVDTKNTEVEFHRDSKGKPFMALALSEGVMFGKKYFIAACEMPRGLTVKRKEANAILTKITDVMVGPSPEIHLNFDGEESKNAILAIYCDYPLKPPLDAIDGMVRDWDSCVALGGLNELCLEYVTQKLRA